MITIIMFESSITEITMYTARQGQQIEPDKAPVNILIPVTHCMPFHLFSSHCTSFWFISNVLQ